MKAFGQRRLSRGKVKEVPERRILHQRTGRNLDRALHRDINDSRRNLTEHRCKAWQRRSAHVFLTNGRFDSARMSSRLRRTGDQPVADWDDENVCRTHAILPFGLDSFLARSANWIA